MSDSDILFIASGHLRIYLDLIQQPYCCIVFIKAIVH